jgi:hypothetical protein
MPRPRTYFISETEGGQPIGVLRVDGDRWDLRQATTQIADVGGRMFRVGELEQLGPRVTVGRLLRGLARLMPAALAIGPLPKRIGDA